MSVGGDDEARVCEVLFCENQIKGSEGDRCGLWLDTFQGKAIFSPYPFCEGRGREVTYP